MDTDSVRRRRTQSTQKVGRGSRRAVLILNPEKGRGPHGALRPQLSTPCPVVVPQGGTVVEFPRRPNFDRKERGDGPLALDDLIDAARRHPDVHRQPILAQTHRFEKVLCENFSRSDICRQFDFHIHSMIINDLDFMRRESQRLKRLLKASRTCFISSAVNMPSLRSSLTVEMV